MTTAIIPLAFNRRTLLRLKALGQQHCIPPDVFVALFFGEIAAVKVLGNLPQLGGDGVVLDFDAVDVRPSQRLGGIESTALLLVRCLEAVWARSQRIQDS